MEQKSNVSKLDSSWVRARERRGGRYVNRTTYLAGGSGESTLLEEVQGLASGEHCECVWRDMDEN